MAYDGSIIFNTGIDNDGFTKGTAMITASAAASGAAVTAAFTAASVAAIKIGSDFEASMSQVAATMGITSASDNFKLLSDAAKEMGATTQFTASQAAEALNYLALAGYSAEKSIEALPTVLNVAAAGGMELAHASDLITDAMSALGLEMSDLTTFSDQLAVTAQKSNTGVSQLGEAILTVGGTAKSLCGGITEMNTVLGVLADNGIKGSEGGTALRNVILSLSAPTNTAAEAMERLKIKAFDAQGNLRPLEETFADINTALSKLTEQEKMQALNEIFNKVDLKSVNALLGTSSERFDELSGYISDCSGAAAQMAETMNDNLKGDLTIMQSALEGLGIAAYEKFQQPMRTAVQDVTASIDKLSKSVSDGELSDGLDNIAGAFSNIIANGAAVLSNDILPALIDTLSFAAENTSLFAGALSGLAVFFTGSKLFSAMVAINVCLATMEIEMGVGVIQAKAFAGSLTLAQYAVGVYSGQITLATAATGLFTKALNALAAHPVLIGLAALTAAVVALKGWFDKESEAMLRSTEITNDYTEAMVKAKSAIEQTMETTYKETDALKVKADRYEELRQRYSSLTNGEMAEFIDLSEELIKILPDGTDLITLQTGAYEDMASAIDKVIQKKVAMNKLESMSDAYVLAKKQNEELEQSYNDILTAAKESYDLAVRSEGFKGTIIDIAQKYSKEQLNMDFAALTQIVGENKRIIHEYESLRDGMYESLNDNSDSYGYKHPAQLIGQKQAEKYQREAIEYSDKIIEQQKKNTEKLESKWKQVNHDYASGSIASEKELYEKKLEIFAKYGDAELEDHWKYYEELYSYDKDFAEKAIKLAKERAEEEKKVIQDKWVNIKNLNDMGYIDDEEAQKRRKAFVDEYYPKYNDESHPYYKEIYDYELKLEEESLKEQEKALKESLKEQADTVNDGLSDIIKKYQNAYDELEKKRESYKNRLLSIGGDIFSVNEIEKDGKKITEYTVGNIDKQLKEMREYHGYINKLKESGASSALLDELTGMNEDDSMFFAKQISKMSSAEFAKVNELYNERQRLADELSSDMYKDEASLMQESFVNALTNLSSSAYDAGISTAESFSEGFNSAMKQLGAGVLMELMRTSGSMSQNSGSYTARTENNNAQEIIVKVDVSGKSNVYLDGRVAGEVVTDFQGTQNRAKGT